MRSRRCPAGWPRRSADPPAGRRSTEAAAAASGLPDRHQLRPRRRHRHRQQDRSACRRSEAGRLPGHREQQAADGRNLQADQARRRKGARGLDGPPQAIRTDSDEEMEASRDDVRLFAIFLDDYHVRRGASVSVREPIARFIADPARALGHARADVPAAGGVVGADDARSRPGHSGPRQLRRPERRLHAAQPAGRAVRELSGRGRSSASAIRCRCRRSRGSSSHMGSLKEGRKALILVSEGYSDTLPPQLRDPIASLPGLDNPEPRQSDGGPSTSPARTAGSFSPTARMQLSLREVWDLANKNNVAIYAVDPRGLPVSEFDLSQPAISLADGSAVPQRHDGHAAATLAAADRRPRHRQSQRSGRPG